MIPEVGDHRAITAYGEIVLIRNSTLLDCEGLCYNCLCSSISGWQTSHLRSLSPSELDSSTPGTGWWEKQRQDEAWSRTQDSLTRSVNTKTAPSQANWAKERCYQYPIENQCKTMALGISFMTWNISDACFAPDWAPRISWTHWLETYTYRYCSLCELYGDLVWAHPLQVLQLLSASNLPPSTGYFHKTHVNFVAFEGSSSLSEWSNGLAEE